MRKTGFLPLFIFCGALTACGSSDEPETGTSPASTAAAARDTDSRIAATAADVAEQARGSLECPAKPATPPREAPMPVDDVVGVRPGLTYDEAANAVLCTNELLVVEPGQGSRGFRIQTYGQTVRQGFGAVFAEDRVNRTSREIMAEMQDAALARSTNRRAADMEGGTARWYVTTMGMPGEERVLAAARIEAYAEGKAPTLAGVGEALVGKYGAPTEKHEMPDRWTFRWAYDPISRKITETSPLYRKCTGVSHPDSGVNLSPDCGVVVEAVIMPARDNPLIARTLQVGVVNQGQGHESLMATERQLESMEKSRRAAQAEAAAQQAGEPTL